MRKQRQNIDKEMTIIKIKIKTKINTFVFNFLYIIYKGNYLMIYD